MQACHSKPIWSLTASIRCRSEGSGDPHSWFYEDNKGQKAAPPVDWVGLAGLPGPSSQYGGLTVGPKSDEVGLSRVGNRALARFIMALYQAFRQPNLLPHIKISLYLRLTCKDGRPRNFGNALPNVVSFIIW